MEINVRNLNNIKRYSHIGTIRNENVSEHTFWVCYYSYKIYQIAKNYAKINIGNLLLKALLHDISECQIGDIPHPTKYANDKIKTEIKNVEYDIECELAEKEFGINSKEVLQFILNAKNDVDGKIVAFADSICVFEYCKEEIMKGNKNMIQVYKEATYKLDKYTEDYFSPFIIKIMADLKEISSD